MTDKVSTETTEIEGDFFPTPSNPYDLTKAQATRLLDGLYQRLVENTGIDDMSPDWHGLINENVRTPTPPSSISSGVKRGNRRCYGSIPHISQPRGKNVRLFFRECDLVDWFTLNYTPYALAKAA